MRSKHEAPKKTDGSFNSIELYQIQSATISLTHSANKTPQTKKHQALLKITHTHNALKTTSKPQYHILDLLVFSTFTSFPIPSRPRTTCSTVSPGLANLPKSSAHGCTAALIFYQTVRRLKGERRAVDSHLFGGRKVKARALQGAFWL